MENVDDSEPTIQELKKQFIGKSVVKQSDMVGDMQQEVVDIIASGIEQYSAPVFNVELASKCIKEQMDKKYGTFWHVIIGEGYAFDVNYQQKSLLFMYYNGSVAVLVYKS